MSIQQVENFRKLRGILNELTAFGLNPRQWRLERISAHPQNITAFTIYHAQDQNFRIRGSWAKSPAGFKVQDLSVVGF